MKAIILVSVSFFLFIHAGHGQQSPELLLGKWKIDMSPQNSSDNNFALMEITSVKENVMKGTFYREGVEMKEGRINLQTEVIYGALISEDNSGLYNTSFYYKEGNLYGSTHAVGRNFLSVWVAVKEN